jgi:hypothetical protein
VEPSDCCLRHEFRVSWVVVGFSGADRAEMGHFVVSARGVNMVNVVEDQNGRRHNTVTCLKRVSTRNKYLFSVTKATALFPGPSLRGCSCTNPVSLPITAHHCPSLPLLTNTKPTS